MHQRALTEEATLHRTRLLLGLTQGAAVVAWADEVLLGMVNAPTELLDVSTTPPGDLSALRLALLPLALEPESGAVLRIVLGEVARDLMEGCRSVHDTASVLRQMRLMLPLPALVDAQLDPLIDTRMLAEVGIGVTIESAEEGVLHWARAQQDPDARVAG